MGNIDLAFANGSRSWHGNREVLVRGKVGLVVHGAERSVV